MARKQDDPKQKRIAGYRKGSPKERRPGILKGHWQNVAVLLVFYDLVVVNLSFIIALWLRYDCRFSSIYRPYLSA